jgi:hypothetical protein
MGAIRNGTTAAQGQIQLNQNGDQLVSFGMAPYTEAVRRGISWATMSTSAVAALVVRPSTTAAFEIFNGYSLGGKSLVIDRLFWFELVSITLAEAASGWAAVTAGKAAVTSGSFAVRGSSGKPYGGSVIAAAGTTVVDSGWFPWANLVMARPVTAAITPMGVAIAEVNGRLIVPPQSSLCLHAVASVVGQTFTQGASWFEEQITVE